VQKLRCADRRTHQLRENACNPSKLRLDYRGMNLPKLKKPDRYVGLYVVDFGDHAGVGFTAQEVAELLESEQYSDCRVYRIHRACPDGTVELKGVRREIFQLEAGMFFYAAELETAQQDYRRLVKLGVESDIPCTAKVHLAKYGEEKFVTAIIYPAEYDDVISSWLLEHNYKTQGPVEGGIEVVSRYYNAEPEILERHQFFAESTAESRTGAELLAAARQAVQR